MRLIYVLFFIFDIAILLAGIFFIFDRILLKMQKNHHYTFHSFEMDGKHGYTLEDDYENDVFYAIKNGEEGNFAIFKFKNSKGISRGTHKVSGPGINTNAPNFTNTSFLFDDVDVWRYLQKRSIVLETTIVSEKLTLYKISKHSKPIVFARKKDGQPIYTMKTGEKNLELVFITLFAIAKTEEYFEHSKAESAEEIQ